MCISRTVCQGSSMMRSGLYYNRHRYYDPFRGSMYSGPDGVEKGDGIYISIL